MNNLINVNMSKSSLLEVAGALEVERYRIKKEDFEKENEPIKSYRKALMEHFFRWNKMVDENEELNYEDRGSIFQRANRLLALPRPRLKVGNQVEVLSYMEEIDRMIMTLTGLNEILEDSRRKLL